MSLAAPSNRAQFRSEIGATIRLATPLIVGQVSAMGMNVADTLIAGRLGAAPLGGVAVGGAVYSFALLLTIGTLGAVTPTVAQLFGARRHSEIAPRVRQAWWIALALGLMVMLVCFNAHPLLVAIGIDDALLPHASGFLRGVAFGGPAAVRHLFGEPTVCGGRHQGRRDRLLYRSGQWLRTNNGDSYFWKLDNRHHDYTVGAQDGACVLLVGVSVIEGG